MAELFVKRWPIGDDWVASAGQPKYLLEMSETEFVSLRGLFGLLYSSTAPRFENYNPDDWLGQIRHALSEGAPVTPAEKE
jgi:hypothetical protein